MKKISFDQDQINFANNMLQTFAKLHGLKIPQFKAYDTTQIAILTANGISMNPPYDDIIRTYCNKLFNSIKILEFYECFEDSTP